MPEDFFLVGATEVSGCRKGESRAARKNLLLPRPVNSYELRNDAKYCSLKHNGQTAAGNSHDLIRNNELALSSKRNLQFSLCISEKAIFLTTDQHYSLWRSSPLASEKTSGIQGSDRQSDKKKTLQICTSLENRPLQIHNNFQNRLAIPKKHRIFSFGLKEAFCRNSINISSCRCKQIPYQYAQTRISRHLAKQHNFCNRSTFLKKHQILSRSLKESFSGNSIQIYDCRSFSPFITLSDRRKYSHKNNTWPQVHVTVYNRGVSPSIIGVSPSTLQWFKSYLSHRKQRTSCGDVMSDPEVWPSPDDLWGFTGEYFGTASLPG